MKVVVVIAVAAAVVSFNGNSSSELTGTPAGGADTLAYPIPHTSFVS